MERLKRFVCIDCGGELEVSNDGKFAKCKACGLTIKIESILDILFFYISSYLDDICDFLYTFY